MKMRKKRAFIYALMFNFNFVNDKSIFLIIFQSIANINDCFDFKKKTITLSKHDENNHAINVLFDANSSHDFFYFF